MNKFDEMAAVWDEDPNRLKRAKDTLAAIKQSVQIQSGFNCLDFGCATGTLSFLLQSEVKAITMVDSSEEMLKVLSGKIASAKVNNLFPSNIDIVNAKTEELAETYDLIYSLMALHHVEEYDKLIANFHKLLNPGGFLCLADLVTEDGSFHGKDFTSGLVLGFDKEELSEVCQKAGLEFVSYDIYTEVAKNGMVFPVFILIAKKAD